MDRQQWSIAHRPKMLNAVAGQEVAVAFVRGMIKRGSAPSCLLIQGPSGCGKTTLARLIAAKLSAFKGDPDKNPDKMELAANVDRGIDDVRKSIQHSRYSPVGGKRRVMIVDEAHGYVGPAASAMLKAVEDSPPKTTWILCTDQPWKLPRQMLNRSEVLALEAVGDAHIVEYLQSICDAEKANFGKNHDAVLERIAKFSNGVPRLAVQLLEHAWTSVEGGARVSDALKGAIASNPGAESFDVAVKYLKAVIAHDAVGAARAVSESASPEGVLDMANQMLIALIRIATGSQPNSGIGWAAKKAINVKASDLGDMLTLQARMVAALDMKGRYTVPVESILYGLARN